MRTEGDYMKSGLMYGKIHLTKNCIYERIILVDLMRDVYAVEWTNYEITSLKLDPSSYSSDIDIINIFILCERDSLKSISEMTDVDIHTVVHNGNLRQFFLNYGGKVGEDMSIRARLMYHIDEMHGHMRDVFSAKDATAARVTNMSTTEEMILFTRLFPEVKEYAFNLFKIPTTHTGEACHICGMSKHDDDICMNLTGRLVNDTRSRAYSKIRCPNCENLYIDKRRDK